MATLSGSRREKRFPALTPRRVAAAGGVGLLGAYGWAVANFRRTGTAGFELSEPPVPGTDEFARMIEGVTGAPVRTGNRVTVLRNGVRMFPSMLEAIAAARETVDFSSYIYWPGAIATRFTDAFVERAQAGVEVRIILDGWGSAKCDRDTVRRLEQAGVKVEFFRPPRWYNVQKLNNRMHRRLLIVDGKVGFAGGVGIADVWTGDAEDPEHWRETHVRVEGPAVRDILGGFLENWTEATREVLNVAHFPYLPEFDDGVTVKVTRSSPSSESTAVAQLFYAAIAGAKERLWMTTAYFTAGKAFMDALIAAAGRGVDVRLLVNGPHVDKEVVRRTAQHSYGRLLEGGVRIYEYQQTMLHAKTLIADGWVNIGSSNFDRRSFALDAELNVSVYDAGIVDEIARHFFEDLEVSKELDLDSWRKRPLRQRVAEHAGELARQSF